METIPTSQDIGAEPGIAGIARNEKRTKKRRFPSKTKLTTCFYPFPGWKQVLGQGALFQTSSNMSKHMNTFSKDSQGNRYDLRMTSTLHNRKKTVNQYDCSF